MKCSYCGAKIKPGKVYCSVCGREAQIVPDYNLEEDFLNALLQEEEEKGPSPSGRTLPKERGDTKKKKKKSKDRALTVAVVMFLVAAIAAIVFYEWKDLSYEGRMARAKKAYENQEYAKAADYAKQALDKKEKDYDACVLLGQAFLDDGDLDGAKQYLLLAYGISDEDTKIFELLIELYEKQKDYDAIELLSHDAKTDEQKKLFEAYQVDAPQFGLDEGEYEEGQEISLTAEPGCAIYYTMHGENPKAEGVPYTEPIVLEEEGSYRIRAISQDARGIYSQEVVAKYTIDAKMPDLPSASPESGTYTEPTPITIDVPDGCRAYYAWNATPDAGSARYTGPIEMIQGNNVLSIILINDKGKTSGVQKYNYIYMP